MKGFNCFAVFISGLLNLAFYANGQNVQIIGNGMIVSGDAIIQNGVIICGLVFCPRDSFQCSVSKESIDANQYMVTQRNCSAYNGQLLLQNINTTTNPYYPNPVTTFSSVNLNGGSVNCNNCLTYAEAVAEAERVAQTVYNATHNLGQCITNQVMNSLKSTGVLQPNYGTNLANTIINSVFQNLEDAGIY